MIVTTMNDIPGYEVDEVFGEVMGLTVRSRNIGSQFGAGLKSIFGGELKGMTKALVDSRHEVMERMIAEAEAKGANAIIAMRFDTSEMGPNWTEICAYGTAVRVQKRLPEHSPGVTTAVVWTPAVSRAALTGQTVDATV